MFEIFGKVILDKKQYLDIKSEQKRIKRELISCEKKLLELKRYFRRKSNGECGMGYKLANMNCTLDAENPFEVLCVKSRKFIQHKGFPTVEAATVFAEKLASENPGYAFVVYGPMVVSKSNIPVETKNWEPVNNVE